MRHFGGPTGKGRFMAIHKAYQTNRQEKKALWFERRASEMRNKPTALEVKLELVLDSLNIHHRKQYVLGDFIVDFFLPAYRIAIEADGPHHEEYKQRQDDIRRDKILEANHSCKVLHLRAHEFFDVDHMKKRINEFLASVPARQIEPIQHYKPEAVRAIRIKRKRGPKRKNRHTKYLLAQREAWKLLQLRPRHRQVGLINPGQLDNPDKEIISIAGMN